MYVRILCTQKLMCVKNKKSVYANRLTHFNRIMVRYVQSNPLTQTWLPKLVFYFGYHSDFLMDYNDLTV